MLKMQTWGSGRKEGAEHPHTIKSGLDFTDQASLQVPPPSLSLEGAVSEP